MSPTQYAFACFALAVVLFSLAFGAYYWNESVHYHIYLALGLILAVLGLAPLVMQAFQHRSR
jgi:multisubunit Na+/H+ antiporter MnhB subunit